MLTSFFSSSKPATLITVLAYMTAGFILVNFKHFDGQILTGLGLWFLFVATMFILNFIAQKNELTKRTSYRIILFAAFTLSIPQALQVPEILISGVCVMLAIRRTLSFRSGLHMERKLFDAGFWLSISILSFFWSWLFCFVLVVALVFYGAGKVRYWLVPLLGMVCVGIFTMCYTLYKGGDASVLLDIIDAISFDFSSYSQLKILIPIAFIISLVLWTLWSYSKEYQKAALSQRPLFVLILLMLVAAVGVILLAPDKSGAEWYFFVIPLSIIVASFMESATGKWFKEIVLWIIVLLPFGLYFL